MRPLPARPPWKWLGNADNLGPARLGAQKDAKPATKPNVQGSQACRGRPGASRNGRAGFSGRRSGGPLASRLQEVAWKMLKFGIRQAGGCGRRPKNAKPTTKPNVQTQKKAPKAPPRPPGGAPRPPEAPGGTPEAPGEARGRPPEASKAPQTRKCTAKTRAPEAPESPPKAPEAPGRFRSSEGHDRKSPQPFRKILKRYRSARDKTLDQSQADKGGSGNLGRQPETRKGIKLGGCLRKQGVGKRNQHTSSWFVAHERCAVA